MIFAFNIREPIGIFVVEADNFDEAVHVLEEHGISENNYQFNKICTNCFIGINTFNKPISEILINQVNLN